MIQSKSDILKEMDMDFLVSFSFKTKLLKCKTYFTKQDFVNGLSRRLNVEQCKTISSLYKKELSVEHIASKFLIELNSNASIIKNLFVSHLFYKEIKSVLSDVVFFEFKVGNARTDVNRINGYSYAFEIKSGRDKAERASFQTKTFSDVFDFVFLVVDDEEQFSNISENIGIIKYQYVDGEINFDTMRRAKRNLELDYFKQLDALSKSQLVKMSEAKEGLDKNELVTDILKTHSESEINALFKLSLKEKYLDKWKFYIEHSILNS